MPEVNPDAETSWANGRLIIDLSALQANWKKLDGIAAGAQTGACVKADAYGHGLEKVGAALSIAGCKTFFVATPQEGADLRKALLAANRQAMIYVFNGPFHLSASIYRSFGLTPVIYSLDDWTVFSGMASTSGEVPFALHVDTGMNRLGLRPDELGALPKTCKPAMIMSHFACGDDPEHPLNGKQIEVFQKIAQQFPKATASLANSAGILAHPDSHHALTRPGIALYGAEAVNGMPNPMQPVATLNARILQVRRAKKGETVGYGATHVLDRDSRIAIAGCGYADGVHRSLSGSGVALRGSVTPGGFGAINGVRVPMIGRISMDLTTFDVTDLPETTVSAGDEIELFGKTISVDNAARAAGTIGYELLTSMGSRYQRSYSK